MSNTAASSPAATPGEIVIVESGATGTAYGMPRVSEAAGFADEGLSLHRLPEAIAREVEA